MRLGQALLRSLRRFFHGCERVIRGFTVDEPTKRAKGRRLIKPNRESMVLPGPAKIQSTQTNFDYKLFLANATEKVQCLHDSMQSIAYRLKALELTHDRLARHSSEVPESVVSISSQMCETLQHVFERWGDSIRAVHSNNSVVRCNACPTVRSNGWTS